LSEGTAGKNRHQSLNDRLALLFINANLPYKSAHKFRHGHAVFGLMNAKSPADYKAVSMNLMHSDIKVTDSIYAVLPNREVQQRISGLASNASLQSEDELHQYINTLSQDEVSKVLIMLAQRLSA
jgi:integrase